MQHFDLEPPDASWPWMGKRSSYTSRDQRPMEQGLSRVPGAGMQWDFTKDVNFVLDFDAHVTLHIFADYDAAL